MITYKEDYQRDEFENQLDPRVQGIVFSADVFSITHGLPEILITEICRTQKQQAEYYPKQPDRPSPHLERPSRAVDLRSRHYTSAERRLLVDFITHWFSCIGVKVLVNDRGEANPHLHIQVPRLITEIPQRVAEKLSRG